MNSLTVGVLCRGGVYFAVNLGDLTCPSVVMTHGNRVVPRHPMRRRKGCRKRSGCARASVVFTWATRPGETEAAGVFVEDT